MMDFLLIYTKLLAARGMSFGLWQSLAMLQQPAEVWQQKLLGRWNCNLVHARSPNKQLLVVVWLL